MTIKVIKMMANLLTASYEDLAKYIKLTWDYFKVRQNYQFGEEVQQRRKLFYDTKIDN